VLYPNRVNAIRMIAVLAVSKNYNFTAKCP